MSDCTRCGSALPGGALEGLCPRCLLQQGLAPPGTTLHYFGDFELQVEIARGARQAERSLARRSGVSDLFERVPAILG